MSSRIQAIIIKGDKVLTVQGINENGRKDNFFIVGEVKDEETPAIAVLRELKEQLGLEETITFSFLKEISVGVKTYLFDLDSKEVELDIDIEKIKASNISYKPVSISWTSISGGSFREQETHYLKLLLEESYKQSYFAPWLELIEKTYFHSVIGRKKLESLYERLNRIKTDNDAGLGNKLTGIISALVLGLLFNYFFIWKAIGISGIIYAILIIAATVYGVRKEVDLKRSSGLVFLIPIILLSMSFSIFNNITLAALNVLIIPFLIVGYLITIRYEETSKLSPSLIINIFDRILNKTFGIMPRFFSFSKEAITDKVKHKGNTTTRNVLFGLLISVPLLIVILVLLSEADMMFNYYLQSIGNIFDNVSLGEGIGRSIIVAIVTLYMFGFLWSFRYNEIKPNMELKIKKAWEPVTIITLISVINIAYLAFTIIQFSYLYGGGLNVLPAGFSYAEYARRGFFELILVTLINFFIILLSMSLTKQKSNKINRLTEASYSILIVFTFNMLISASYKMHLYEKAYGFTQLRIFVQAFMILIGIILAIVLAGIWNKRLPIFKYAFIAILIVYVALNYINVDRVIARENINRYYEINKIDINYLRSLSYDATPELLKLLESDDLQVRAEIENHLLVRAQYIEKSNYKWYQYNYYRTKMMKELLDNI